MTLTPAHISPIVALGSGEIALWCSNEYTLIGPEAGITTIAAVHSQCPLWVKSRRMQCKRACPLYP